MLLGHSNQIKSCTSVIVIKSNHASQHSNHNQIMKSWLLYYDYYTRRWHLSCDAADGTQHETRAEWGKRLLIKATKTSEEFTTQYGVPYFCSSIQFEGFSTVQPPVLRPVMLGQGYIMRLQSQNFDELLNGGAVWKNPTTHRRVHIGIIQSQYTGAS